MARKQNPELELENAKVEVEEKEEVVTAGPAPEVNEAAEENFEEDLMVDEHGNKLLFPGGPTEHQVEEWKSAFNEEVYLVEFDDQVFIWRPLRRTEYKSVMNMQGADQYYREEKICDTAILYPVGYGFAQLRAGKAGIPTVLADTILEKSGFTAKTGAIRL
ncbi:tail chaperonin_gp098 [Bacillus phage vB_BceM_WH1]|nr:tail chaperonin_gp098 [Bacillus phage vB_BceM_WH1]